MANITALVHSINSSKTLAGCLDSLKWADKVLVIDMESSDDSVKIAKKYDNVEVLSHKNLGYVEPARNFAMSKVKNGWTLIVDADEEISESLAKELTKIAATQNQTSAEIFFLPRKNMIFGKWIAHTGWWPDHQLRFFKSGAVTWPEKIHGQPSLTGESIHLPADPDAAIIHHNYQTIEQFIDRLNRYTSIEVENSANDDKTASALDLSTVFSQEFCRRFFAEEGFEDGQHGLALSYLQSMYQVSVALKKWQKNDFTESSADQADELVQNTQAAMTEIKYWLMTYRIQHSTGLTKLWLKLRRKLGL